MFLIHIKSKNFPTKITVDLNDWDMAKGFYDLLGGRFIFVINRITKPGLFEGLPHIEMKAPKKLRSVYNFFWWPVFYRRLRKSRPEEKDFWVWTNEPFLLLIISFWSIFLPCKILLEFIGSFSHSVEKPVYRLARTFNDIWSASLSETARQLLISFDKKYEVKSFVLRTGYNPESLNQKFNQEAVRQEIGAEPDDLLVCYSGHFETNGPKGVELMIKSLRHIENPKVKMYFVGGYEHEIEEFSKLAKSYGVEDRVIFVPWQRDLKKAMYYASAADVMAIPTSQANQHNQFSFPVKIWEYLALGKPVISSDLPINREVLNENNASFFELGDHKEFAQRVLELESDRELIQKLGQNGKETAVGQTWPERARKVVEFIKTH